MVRSTTATGLTPEAAPFAVGRPTPALETDPLRVDDAPWLSDEKDEAESTESELRWLDVVAFEAEAAEAAGESESDRPARIDAIESTAGALKLNFQNDMIAAAAHSNGKVVQW
ncbi:BQ5605_C029g10649 [Microbotryum silenes-dioicae]|uniref:BQ5605_C029g10649 protein n=1 Tax=Microbotryum silenes-dioicae TaxID=796604 RepID=A0A2X0PJ64_9BASI|nr:BQ5605_C029g10649 [Microbotryum silenes-dioicae]